ncbi:MAG: DUF434 domain-containing protein [Bacteroidota bacterium]
MAQRNRGKQSKDDEFFAPKWHPIFTSAIDDMVYLLSRGYASGSALQLVGNRHRLNKRQRLAIQRISTSEQDAKLRGQKSCPSSSLQGASVEIDGFNLLILLEGAISGAYIFQGRDGIYRDISSVHGSYKRVQQTESAIHLIGNALQSLQVQSVKWYLDQPISNSGRLKTRLLEISEQEDWGWEVELVYSPDKVLAQSQQIVISSDGWILDQATRWFNLGAHLIDAHLPQANLLKL